MRITAAAIPGVVRNGSKPAPISTSTTINPFETIERVNSRSGTSRAERGHQGNGERCLSVCDEDARSSDDHSERKNGLVGGERKDSDREYAHGGKHEANAEKALGNPRPLSALQDCELAHADSAEAEVGEAGDERCE